MWVLHDATAVELLTILLFDIRIRNSNNMTDEAAINSKLNGKISSRNRNASSGC